jgi:hypothetical protein
LNDVPDHTEIAKIARDTQSDAVAVNRRITDAYHRLSEAARRALNAGTNLDWCGFAKWSSHTVGLVLGRHPAGARLAQLAGDVEDHLAITALRGGNTAIFFELGSIFVHLLGRLAERRVPHARSDRDFAEAVVEEIMSSPGQLLLAPLRRDMLATPSPDLLVHGIALYLRAAREPDHRAELMLAGNMLFSMYEQARADRLITIGICAPVRARLIPVIDALSDKDTRPSDVLLAGVDHEHGVIRAIETAVARELTNLLLVVEIANTRVRLGHPELLPRPQVTPTLPDTAAVMADVARRAAGRKPNWIDLDYRLGFIGRYFAAFQQTPEATSEPPHPA